VRALEDHRTDAPVSEQSRCPRLDGGSPELDYSGRWARRYGAAGRSSLTLGLKKTEEAIVWELEQVEREEREARLRLESAREQALMNEGEAHPEHHELIHKLEAEWKHARERLHGARHAAGD
jgi:hypothetical protein